MQERVPFYIDIVGIYYLFAFFIQIEVRTIPTVNFLRCSIGCFEEFVYKEFGFSRIPANPAMEEVFVYIVPQVIVVVKAKGTFTNLNPTTSCPFASILIVDTVLFQEFVDIKCHLYPTKIRIN
jgi:hypothetical protein